MRRFVLLLTVMAVLAGTVATTTASARLAGGMGDQNYTSFTDSGFKALKIKRTRLIIPWNTVLSDPGRISQYLAAAKAQNIRVLVAFNATGGSRCPSSPCVIPSAKAYKSAFKTFRQKFPSVKEFNFWNETNSATQPTGATKASVLKKTAALYRAAKSVCGRKCTVTGPDILDQGIGDKRRSVRSRNQKRMKKWVGLFLRYSRGYPKIWGLHNYGDTNYGRSTGTAFFQRSIAKRGQIWVTETGGIYEFKQQSGKVVFKPSASRQAKATTNAYRVAKKFRRITRLYYYQWRKNNQGDFFDAGIRSFEGGLRPAYNSLKKLPKAFWR